MSQTGGFGVEFKIGDDQMSGSPTYMAVAYVEKINGLSIKSILSEITHHASPGGFREKLPSGVFEVDNVELELGLDMSQPTHKNAAGGLMHALLNKTKLAYQMIFPDTGSTTWTFDAFVESVEITSELEEHLKATVSLAVTGQPTLS